MTHELIIATIIVFSASILQSAIGFGFAIMATPFLLLVFNSRDVVLMSNILSLIIATLLVPKIKQDIDHNLLKRLISGSFLGVFAGLLFFIYVSLDVLKLTVSLVILIVTISLNIRWFFNHFKPPPKVTSDNTQEASVNKDTPDKDKRNELLVGLCAGALTTGIGMPGVPLALYFNVKNTPKAIARSTTLAFFIAVYITSIVTQTIPGSTAPDALKSAAILVPPSIVGVFLGNMLFYKINQSMFQIIANIILLFTGFYMLFKAI